VLADSVKFLVMGSADRNRKKRYTVKRRRRFGNQATVIPTTDVLPSSVNDEPQSQAHNMNTGVPPTVNEPLNMDAGIPSVIEDANHDFNFIMNCQILSQIGKIMNEPCDTCNNYASRSLSVDPKKKHGLSQSITIDCSCGSSKLLHSSKKVDPSNAMSHFDINVRTVICFRELGLGHSSIVNFSRHMNMSPPLGQFAYEKIVNLVHPIYQQAAEDSMARAASSISNNGSDDQPSDIVASFDGSWQRRGYASLNGFVSCIERNKDKIIDVEIKTKKCKSCSFWENKKDSPNYQNWKETHVCQINHHGSASSMETNGTVDMFKRSIEKRNLRYTTFIGDGDSSSYPTVVELDPYNGTGIEKGECIGHVQKRVGTNLRKIRKELPKERKRKIFGRGKLTDAAINYIQNCYGLAIRQNTNSLYQMKKNVSAILYHCSDIKPDDERHKWCNRSPDSWCSYWNQKKKSTCSFNLPESIKDEPEIKGLFERLRDEKLLKKCLHGKTQNVNESFNGIVWTRCPKRVYVNRKTLEIGISSAIIEFNEGKTGIEAVLKGAKLSVGKLQSVQNQNALKRHSSSRLRKSSSPGKQRLKTLRAIKKNWADKNKEKEGKVYEAGGF